MKGDALVHYGNLYFYVKGYISRDFNCLGKLKTVGYIMYQKLYLHTCYNRIKEERLVVFRRVWDKP